MTCNPIQRCAVAALLLTVGLPLAQVRADEPTTHQQLQQMQQRIEQLETEVRTLRSKHGDDAQVQQRRLEAMDQLMHELQADLASRGETLRPIGGNYVNIPLGGGATFRLIDISAITLVTAGASTARDDDIATLQAGGHDPKRRGFTLQQLELSLAGAVDPFFTGEAHIVFTDEVQELEEAFITTTFLPGGLEVELGYFLTEFGRVNPQHAHSWDWIDQPIIASRLLGPEGMRGLGFRAGWLTPLPWYSELHFGMQNADNESMASFISEGPGHSHGDDGHGHGHDDLELEFEQGLAGRPIARDGEARNLADFVYLVRWVNAFDISDTWSAQLGASGLFGPNVTGPGGDTLLGGLDLVVKWRPVEHRRGYPFLIWQTEVMGRRYKADSVTVDLPDGLGGEKEETIPGDTLEDWGFYTQLLYGFREGWAAGMRYEYASGSGDILEFEEEGSGEVNFHFHDRAEDPFLDDRHRISPMLVWRPTEFSRFRLQYNYDWFEHPTENGDDHAHSLWLGVDILLGTHPAHQY
jgi:hypothetical protein